MNNYSLVNQMQYSQQAIDVHSMQQYQIVQPTDLGVPQQQWVLRPANAPPLQQQQQIYLQNGQQHYTDLNQDLSQVIVGVHSNGYTTYPQNSLLVNNCLTDQNTMTPSPVVHMSVNGAGVTGAPTGTMTNEECGIREVWAHNLDTEFRTICQVVQDYNFVAMDTEFPGVVARPIGEFKSTADYQYQLLRCNVDLLKIIQLGLTFLDDKGKLPEKGPTTWQFNFKFNLTEDMYAEDSVDLLQNSGIQFEKHEQEGIDPNAFAELMLISGLVLMDNVKWLSFHSGYDFGYLLNLLTNENLPKTEGEFFELLKLYFPNVYDVKYLMKSCKNLKGGLQEVANELEVLRIGPQHQAGSDSLLTGLTFFKMREMFFEDDIDDSKYCGHLYGLGTNFVVGNNTNNSNSTGNSNANITAAAPAANPALENSSAVNTGSTTPSETENGPTTNGTSDNSSDNGINATETNGS